MNTLTDREGNPMTMEKINEIFLKMLDRCSGTAEAYLSYIDQISTESGIDREYHGIGDLAAMCAVQGNLLYIVKMVLCELFGIDDTPAAGEGDIQAEQSRQAGRTE